MADAIPTVLVADDQPDVIAALRLLLRTAGFDAQGAGSVADLRTQLASRSYDAVLMDLNYARDTTSGAEGLDLISDLHAQLPHLPLIAMTGWANVDTAVEAMRRGARGYIPKPWNNEALVQVLRAEIDHARDTQAAAGESREWREAQAIHRALLPSVPPDVAGCRLAWRWEPASGFGGDYYDAFQLGPDHVALCIADVCGKGLPAALLVSSLQATVRAFVDEHTLPHDAVTRINRALCRQGAHGRFVTLFVAVLDLREGTMRYCNAGHNLPILVRKDGGVSRLDTGGAIVGVFDGAAYDSGRTTVEPGDRLLLFTDGLVEAGCSAAREFGDDHLVDTVVRHRALDAAMLLEQVFGDVHQWAGRRLDDDATALAIAFNARPGSNSVVPGADTVEQRMRPQPPKSTATLGGNVA
ncbi:MAG TPA: SpoIIE family protein phosphatase [Vicinamibacterales bacterium]|jgi:sigma-B regulation protein RsbU (phosphoserine phosphatase)|nr:SpoIIE family protein phosphatase [Vicinamibacterales bacterium]